MEKYIDILEQVKLFAHVDKADIITMLHCLDAKLSYYKKGSFLLLAGDPVDSVGVILSGNAHVIKEDFDGERIILTALATGDYYAEALCCANVDKSPLSVIANSDVQVLKLGFSRILHTCSNTCAFHIRLIQNMLHIISRKNMMLQDRMEILTQKTLRMKILKYLQSFGTNPKESMSIPFNREELADFLCVDRSALSHELSRMKRDGIIEYHKNSFTLF